MANVEAAILSGLGRNGVCTSAVLQREVRAGPPALLRAFKTLGDRVVRIGGGRATRYGLRRSLPHIGSCWPLVRVDTHGNPQFLGLFHALARDQYWLDSPLGVHPPLSEGLPFWLQDLTPRGFVGRSVPIRHAEIELPARSTDWSADYVLSFLCRRGEDCVGNLIVGEESLQRFLRQSNEDLHPLEASRRERDYPRLANEALAGTLHGSLVCGEHPKFTASIRQGNAIRHVLVKFSPEGSGAIAQRWRDLLVCEHVATRALQRAGLTSLSSELLVSENRTFIESVRFDRTGLRGRIGVVSLAALANEFLGGRHTWPSATTRLSWLGLVNPTDAEIVRRLWTFGRLIANTDMHLGNLSFHLTFEGAMPLAPVYDMLPMFYAPTPRDSVVTREFEVPLPSSENLDIWETMASLAESYWREVADHSQLSAGFAAIANANAGKVAQARRLAMPAR